MRRRFVPPSALLLVCALLLSSSADGSRAQQLAVATHGASYAALEREIADEINLARTRPAEYARMVEQFRSHYNGLQFGRPGQPGVATVEGVAALEEAVRVLSASKPRSPLAISEGMCSGAKALAEEQAASGSTGHKGADGSFCEQRLGRFGMLADPVGENLSYGQETARERVVALLIDDGFANRGHRERLLNPAFKVVGVSCGGHKLGTVCVITLAAGFTQKPSPAAGQKPSAGPVQKRTAPSVPAGSRRL